MSGAYSGCTAARDPDWKKVNGFRTDAGRQNPPPLFILPPRRGWRLSSGAFLLAARASIPHGSTVIGGYIAAIAHALEARGVDAKAALHRADIPGMPTNDPLARVPLASVHRLLEAAVESTGDAYFGLFAATFVHPASFHALGFALLASGSLRDYCTRLSRYFRFLTGTTRPELRELPRLARLEFVRAHETPALSDDIVGLFLIRTIRDLSDGRVQPTMIELHRPTPPDGGTRHREAFGCPMRFGASLTAFVFDRSALDLPFSSASRELAEQHDRIVVSYLAKLDRNDVHARVSAALLTDLPSGAVSKERIAERLAMSPRTLQAKLAARGTTFLDVVNETREALACGYLRGSVTSITEIAFMLGFSDTSNFCRAFRRWTGQTPSAYRTHSASTPTSHGVVRKAEFPERSRR